jgi:enoyl-CoA hydratase/carnithine racemase
MRRDGNVAIITVDNPPVNALRQGVRQGLAECFAQARDDASVEAIVVTGAGRTFVAGADITEFGKPSQPPSLIEVIALIDEIKKPTIAAVHGTPLGGGLELTMGCHFRVAAPTTRLGLPEIKLGIIPGFGGTQRLPRLVGANKALEMNLIGDPMGAEEAFEFGLVNRVVEDHELLDTALSWARKLAQAAPIALEQIKRVSAAGELEQGIEDEKRAFAEVFASTDAKEGIAAFLGKRAPHFQGK